MDFSAEIEHKQRELVRLRRSIEEHRFKRDAKEKELCSIKRRLSDYCLDIEAKEREYHDIRLTVEDRRRELEDVEEALITAQKQTDEHERKLRLKEEECNWKLQRLDQLISDRNEIHLEMQRAIEACGVDLGAKESRLLMVEGLIQERERELELKGVELDNVYRDCEQKEEEFRELSAGIANCNKELRAREEELDSMQAEINQLVKELESNKKEFDSLRRLMREKDAEIEMKEKKLREGVKDLESMKKEFDGRVKEFELIEKEYRGQGRELKEKERKFEERMNEVEAKKKQLQARVKEFESKDRQFEGRVKDIELREKQFEGRVKDIELREKQFEERVKDIELREKHFEGRVKEIELREKEFEGIVKEIELREKQFDGKVKEIELREKQFDGKVKEIELQEKQFERLAKELESQQRQLMGRVKELVLKEKQFDEQAKHLESKEKQYEGQLKEFGSQEKQFEAQLKELKSERNQFEQQVKEFDSKQKYFEGQMKEFETKHKLFRGQMDAHMSKEKKLQVQENILESKEKQYDWQVQELKAKEKQFEVREKELESKEKEFETQVKNLESQKSQYVGQIRAIEIKKAMLNEQREGLKSKEKHLEAQMKDLESKKNQYEEKLKELDFKEAQVNVLLKKLKSKEKLIEDLESKKNLYEEQVKELELKEAQFRLVLKKLELEEKQFERTLEDLQSKQNQLTRQQKELELKEKRYESSIISYEEGEIQEGEVLKETSNILLHQVKSEQSDFTDAGSVNNFKKSLLLSNLLKSYELVCSQVSDALQTSADPSIVVLDTIKGFCCPQSKQELAEYDANISRRIRNLLMDELKKSSPVISSHVKQEAMKFASDWKASIAVADTDCLGVLDFLKFVATYEIGSSFNENELQSLLYIVFQHSQAPLALANFEELPDNQICPTTDDGRDLQLISIEPELIGNDILAFLQTASDPASLVLDIILNPIVPHDENDGVSIDGSRIILLEQLMRISPSPFIRPHIRDAAKKLAIALKAKFNPSDENSSMVLGFLLLLSAYGLGSFFDEDEVFKLFEFVAQHKLAVELFQTLGFADKISDFVQNLIEKKQYIEAVRFICAYKLADKINPIRLLGLEIGRADQISGKNGGREKKPLEKKVRRKDIEIHILGNVLQCILDNNLGSQDLVNQIQRRILFIEKQKEELIAAERQKEELGRLLSKLSSPLEVHQPEEEKCAKVASAENQVQPADGAVTVNHVQVRQPEESTSTDGAVTVNQVQQPQKKKRPIQAVPANHQLHQSGHNIKRPRTESSGNRSITSCTTRVTGEMGNAVYGHRATTENVVSQEGRKYRGVKKSGQGGRWGAVAAKKWLGTFETAEAAARAYDEAALRISGDKAILNFPESVALRQ